MAIPIIWMMLEVDGAPEPIIWMMLEVQRINLSHHMDDVRGYATSGKPIIWMMLEDGKNPQTHHMDDVRGSNNLG